MGARAIFAAAPDLLLLDRPYRTIAGQTAVFGKKP
jgi:hypothetical protein